MTHKERFEKLDWKNGKAERKEYEACTFVNCDLSSADLSSCKFIDCEFLSCNLSMCRIDKTSFQDVVFKDSKMLGMPFDKCSNFSFRVKFESCLLDNAIFYRLKMSGTQFLKCRLREVDFTEADLSKSVFYESDLSAAIFDSTVLEHADFRSARSYSIDPRKNKIKKAQFSMQGLPGLLDHLNILIED
jgi:uncharacterized protein YjbI with pentapeptide repeats